MKEWISIIQNVGFPIAVALYLLFRYDKRLGELSDIMNKVNENLATLVTLIKGGK